MKWISFFAIFFSFSLAALTKNNPEKTYLLTKDPIDVVIPCIARDLVTLELCIEGIRNHCAQIRRIVVVSSEPLTDQAEWFDEKNYPFTKKDIALNLFAGNEEEALQYFNEKSSKLGWYYQQLLKLYALFVIPGISPNVLVVDADTIFLNRVEFLNATGAGLYNPGREYHLPYFKHAERLTGGRVKRVFPRYSGISHHMLFQQSIMEDLFCQVESLHQKEFWKAFCQCVDKSDVRGDGASEYEIYFNFAFTNTSQVEIRPLKWLNISKIADIPLYKKKKLHYVSCHHWLRK